MKKNQKSIPFYRKGNRITLLASLVFLLTGSVSCTEETEFLNLTDETRKKTFALYDAMHYANKPDLGPEGLKPVILLYESTLTSRDPQNQTKMIIDPSKMSKQAALAKQRPDVIVSTDIEQWFDDKDLSGAEMNNRFKILFEAFKKENPAVKIGNYGLAPSCLNIYRFYDKSKSRNDQLLASWRAFNAKRFASIQHADIIFPSLYIPDPNIASWKEDFITTMKEIKRQDPEKPVVVYLWPAYYNAPWSEYSCVIVKPEIWKEMLETAYEYADGAIIWAMGTDKNKKKIYWTDPAVQQIWNTTRAFMIEKGIQ